MPPPPVAVARTVQGRLVRAEILGDHVEADRLMAVLRAEGSDFEVLAGACVIAVHLRFGTTVDLREVGRFVAEHGVSVPGRVSSREAEAIIRSVLGEVYLLDAVGPDPMVAALWSVLAVIVTDLALSPAEVDRLINVAERGAELISRLGMLDVIRSTLPEATQGRWQLPHNWATNPATRPHDASAG